MKEIIQGLKVLSKCQAGGTRELFDKIVHLHNNMFHIIGYMIGYMLFQHPNSTGNPSKHRLPDL
jgi:hypothetical protein